MKNNKSAERKRQRTIKKIYEIIKNKDALFLSMSFNDATLKKTNAETRKRYIKDFLKNNTALYIANIDYGEKNEREHYHAIAKATTLKYVNEPLNQIKNLINLKAYKYGNIQADIIGLKYGFNNDAEIKQTAINLYNHAIKETTRNNKLIYSRCEPTENEQLKRIRTLYIMLNNKSYYDLKPY